MRSLQRAGVFLYTAPHGHVSGKDKGGCGNRPADGSPHAWVRLPQEQVWETGVTSRHWLLGQVGSRGHPSLTGLPSWLQIFLLPQAPNTLARAGKTETSMRGT